ICTRVYDTVESPVPQHSFTRQRNTEIAGTGFDDCVSRLEITGGDHRLRSSIFSAAAWIVCFQFCPKVHTPVLAGSIESDKWSVTDSICDRVTGVTVHELSLPVL